MSGEMFRKKIFWEIAGAILALLIFFDEIVPDFIIPVLVPCSIWFPRLREIDCYLLGSVDYRLYHHLVGGILFFLWIAGMVWKGREVLKEGSRVT